MSMGAGGAGEYKSDINITPLVDVVLVLLIIFMVITPLLQMGYDVKVPPKTPPTEPNQPPPADLIIVSLTDANKIYLNKDEVNAQTLSLRLTEILKNRANKTIFFSGSDGTTYGEVIKVMDLCRNAGAKNIGVVMEAVPVGQ